MKETIHIWISIFLYLIVIGYSIGHLFISKWFEYCYFEWSLFDGYCTKTNLKNWAGSDSESINSIHDNICNRDYKTVIDNICDQFCDYIEGFGKAGETYMFFQIVINIVICAIIIVLLLLLKKVNMKSTLIYVSII